MKQIGIPKKRLLIMRNFILFLVVPHPQAPLPSQSNLHPLGQGMMLNEK
jgi:hypothetical protein